MQDHTFRLSIKPLLISLILFLALAIFVKSQFDTIAPLTASAPENVFSAERAFLMLQHLTNEQVPHPVDSKANRVVEERLISLLRNMGYQAEIQAASVCHVSSKKGRTRCTQVRNIIVRIAGTLDDKGILLSAHYDSVPAGPGGSDAGAAVGTLLETARLLSKLPQPRNTIVLLFNEGEEFRVAGSHAFMDQHPYAKQLQIAINIEARGSSGKSILFETGEDSGWLVKHYRNTTPAPLSSSLFYEVYKFLPNYTDLTTYKEYGLQGLNFAHAEREPHYHTPLDNLDNLDKGSLQHHGDNVWGVIRSIKDIDISDVQTGNLVYTDVLGLFIIQWEEASSLWISIGLLVFLLVSGYLTSKQRHLRMPHIIKSLAGMVAILILCGLTALLMQKTAQFFGSTSQPWRVNTLPMQVALWLGVLITGLVTGKWVAKNSLPLELAFGLALGWVLLSIIGSVFIPGISFLFIIPAIICVAGLLVLPLFRFRVCSMATLMVLMAMSAAISFMPAAYILETMVSYDSSVAISVMLSFIVCALLPLLAVTSDSKTPFFKLNCSMSLIAIIALGWTVWQAPYTAWSPQGLNIRYIQNSDNTAFILAGTQNNQLPESLLTALGETELAAKIPWSNTRYHSKETISHEVSATRLSRIESDNLAVGRKLRLTLHANDDHLSDVRLFIPVDAGLDTISTGSGIYHYKNKSESNNGFYEFHCRGMACGKIDMTLSFSRQQPVKMMIAKIVQGLPPNIKKIAQQRGSTAVEADNGDQSIILSEFEL